MAEEKDLQNNDGLEEEVVLDSEDLDISFDDISADSQEKINKLKGRLKDCQKEKENYLSGWQRCKADFVNAKRSDEKERLSLLQTIDEGLIKELLPILDSFNLAFMNEGKTEKIPESWRTGFFGIYSKMLEILEHRGLKQIGQVGDKFNIREQEPVAMIPVSEESLDESVTEVLQLGYSLNGKVIIAAKVKIGQYNKKV